MLLISMVLAAVAPRIFLSDAALLDGRSNLFQVFPTDEPVIQAHQADAGRGSQRRGLTSEVGQSWNLDAEDPPETKKRDWAPIDNFVLSELKGAQRDKILEKRKTRWLLDWSDVDHDLVIPGNLDDNIEVKQMMKRRKNNKKEALNDGAERPEQVALESDTAAQHEEAMTTFAEHEEVEQ